MGNVVSVTSTVESTLSAANIQTGEPERSPAAAPSCYDRAKAIGERSDQRYYSLATGSEERIAVAINTLKLVGDLRPGI